MNPDFIEQCKKYYHLLPLQSFTREERLIIKIVGEKNELFSLADLVYYFDFCSYSVNLIAKVSYHTRKLEDANILKIEINRKNRRQRYITLTDKGRLTYELLKEKQ